MKMVDLFCGAGGMGLGFEQAGFDIVYALDFDKYAVQSYNENMKTTAIQGDITKVKGSEIFHKASCPFVRMLVCSLRHLFCIIEYGN